MKIHRCFLSTLALLILSSGSSFAQDQQQLSKTRGGRTTIPTALIDSLEAHPDLVYARYGERELQLDLYRPKDAGERKLPAIVCIHGGGWWQGSRLNHTHVAQALAARGFVTATISYRLSGEVPFPAQIHDCKAAVRFLRAKAETFGIDSDHIGAIGLSAGGHLTALLGTSGGVEELEGDGGHPEFSSTIQAAVPMGAQTNFRSHFGNIKRTPSPKPGEKPNIWVQFLDSTPEENPERWDLASPITHLGKGDPPMHFLTGELDNESTHAVMFRAKMRALGIPDDLTIIAGAPHAFPGKQDFFDQMVEVAVSWFDSHLKPQ
jgi:pectinesterase